jgi:hypothetical protein
MAFGRQGPRRAALYCEAENAASCLVLGKTFPLKGRPMATKERLAAMAASRCALCSGTMVFKLIEADPSDGALELRTYACAGCGHSQTYSVNAGAS